MAPRENYEKFRDLFVTDISIQNTLLATQTSDDFLEVAVMLAKDRGIELDTGELSSLIVSYGKQKDTDSDGNPQPRQDESPICIRLNKLEKRPTGDSLASIIAQIKSTLSSTNDPQERICLW